MCDCVGCRGRSDVTALYITDHDQTFLMAQIYSFLEREESGYSELLVHGNLRFDRRNDIASCLDNTLVKPVDYLGCCLKCFPLFPEHFILYSIRDIRKHGIQSYDDRSLCSFNAVYQLFNHL